MSIKRKLVIFSILVVLLATFFVAWFLIRENNLRKEAEKAAIMERIEATRKAAEEEEEARKSRVIENPIIIKRPKPKPVSMERVRKQGCVADGLLSEYNPENDKFIELINRSNCYYLHRAVETWLTPPDFTTIDYVMSQITKKDVVYGMFIAEAIDYRDEYFKDITGREFDFEKMCREGGKENPWGPHTCKPDFGSKEYRDYIEYITHRAIDLGIQSFTFGQIYMQEGSDKDWAPKIVKDIRDYAKKKGVDVIIGAQTGAITDPSYLGLFDYIEGGVGIDGNGNVENGPRLSWRGGCWALLWHNNFSNKAKNVLLHLDWTGIKSDDLDVFARMTRGKRAETLEKLYNKFNTDKTGFLMPFFGVLANDNGGCRGPKKKFYSPDNEYTCKDEDVINKILAGTKN